MSFYKFLEENRNQLNQTEEKILTYLIKEKNEVEKWTIREVAQQFYTVPNTIVRMCQKLGFQGFVHFKNSLKDTLVEEKSILELTDLDSKIVKTKQFINDEIMEKVLQAINEADQILFFAVGLSRFPAEEFSERLKILGKRSQTFIDPHLMKHNAKQMTEKDLGIALSLSGSEKSNVFSATNRANISGAKTISLTGFSTNELSKITDLQLYVYSTEIKIEGLDASDRFGMHYLLNRLFKDYVDRYSI
ncbi:MurR/RpiR family transcriptional regulator [Marinilactibacillus sp. Marseille-P9653]|uniref:MurR/RpiR family transcriptional regulator n=1 Tax=Marinilactibacillus sp. Marseille-P9653 TaxID=2866583 RepID=UPI001CE478AE|nr:MurR/RpiR family transcriptional regulator [Marinilactibacillus sp. Marseille-P9653]